MPTQSELQLDEPETEAEGSTRVQEYFAKLKLPTRPGFDLERDSSSKQYVPPPVLNNRILDYTNALAIAGEAKVATRERLTALKLVRNDAERQLQRFKADILKDHPITTNAAKNLTLTDAHVRAGATLLQKLDQLERLENQLAEIDDRIEFHKSKLENYSDAMETVKLASQNIQTHLSWIKSEKDLGGRGGYGA